MDEFIDAIMESTAAKIILVILIMAFIGSLFPEDHSKECIKADCSSEKASGSNYCYLHKPIPSSLSSSSSSKSNTTKSNYSSGTGGTYKSTTKKSSSKKMPDCDDYDSYDDFMDDWDGRMPDGSDAEDYWENW